MIRKVSIPLVVGMIVAAEVGPSPLLAAASLTAASFLLSIFALRRNRSFQVPYVIFFLLGISCRMSWAVFPCSFMKNPFDIEWLSSMISGTGFKDSITSPLVTALLTGRKQSLDPATMEAFRIAGASHILALSGLHLGVIYGLVSKAFAIIGSSLTARRFRSAAVIGLSFVYMMMTGAGPSIVRAFLFIALSEIAGLHPERKKESLSVLWTAATIQLVLNPGVLDSLGFQLSYLSMLGIFIIYPRLKDWYPAPQIKGPASHFDVMRKIWCSVALSFSCQVMTAPLVYLSFGTFPRYFILTNLIALPLTSALIIVSLACILLTPAGMCPTALTELADFLAQCLTDSLRIISSM